MKKWAVVGLLLVLSLSAGAAQITLVADSWCPYNCEPDSELPGFMVEAATLIFGAAGHEVKYLLISDWDQALVDTREGKYNGVVGASPSDAIDFVYPAESMGVSQNLIYVRKGDAWKYDEISSLEDKKVVVLSGYSYSDEVDGWLAANAQHVDTLEQAVEALLSGKADVLFENEYVMSLFALQNNIQESMDVAGNLESDDVFVAFSPAFPESKTYADLLTQGVKAMKADGSWKALLGKYGLEK